ncbi:unnamed protein product [Clonostachys rosea]|uniref:Ubiquitin-like protease family profile domain-containing protein n=1 Tax=Bionectria ochroleuca TaxID=29856 RepID=A0ABY6U243_BIOOC|nr:unnamed protein product [Clonostachys rosea]
MIFNLFNKFTTLFQNGQVDTLDISENTDSLPSPLESTSMASHQRVPGRGHPERDRLPIAIVGSVQLQQRGPMHLFEGEAVRDGPHGELPQYVVRKRQLDHENETMKLLKTGGQIRLIGDPEEETLPSGEDRERLEETYGRLEKLPAEYMSSQELQNSEWHDDEAWLRHVKVMHNLLSKIIRNSSDRSAWMEETELHHLLKICTHGMEQDVAVLEPFTIYAHDSTVIRKNEFTEFGTGKYFHMSLPPFYKFGNDEPLVQLLMEKVKAEIFGKRWLVAPVNTQTNLEAFHWGMSIFDRLTQQLYIFDSSMDFNYHDRIKATALGWARFWHKLELPYDFQFFVPRVAPQWNVWECGYLSAVWALLTLRSPPNPDMGSNKIDLQWNFSFSTRDQEKHDYAPPSMHIADWTGRPPPIQHSGEALKQAYDFLFKIICNELGFPASYLQANEITESVSCHLTNHSWVPRDEHQSCVAKVHRQRIELHIKSHKISGQTIIENPGYSRVIPLGPEVQRLICSARARYQLHREAETQTTGAPSLIAQPPVVNEVSPLQVPDEQMVGSGDNEVNDDGNSGGENPTTSRVSKPKTKPKAQSKAKPKTQPKSRAKATSNKKAEAQAEGPAAPTPAPTAVTTRSGRQVKPPQKMDEPAAPKPKAAPKASETKSTKKKSAAAKPDTRREGAKRGATKETKATGAKSKKRALEETEPEAGENSAQVASSEMPKSKKRKVADPPAASKSAKTQKKGTRAKR